MTKALVAPYAVRKGYTFIFANKKQPQFLWLTYNY